MNHIQQEFSLELPDHRVTDTTRQRVIASIVRNFGLCEIQGDCIYFETAKADSEMASRLVRRLEAIFNR